MTSRELPPAEWPRLAGTDLGAALTVLAPPAVRVAVVEDDTGAIIGAWSLLSLYHAEGVWIAPDHRKRASVARRLWRQMQAFLREGGADRVITGAATEDVARLLEAHGAEKVPFQEYVLCLSPSR